GGTGGTPDATSGPGATKSSSASWSRMVNSRTSSPPRRMAERYSARTKDQARRVTGRSPLHSPPPATPPPPPPHPGHGRDPGTVSEVGVRRAVDHDQVGPGAHAEVTDVGPAQRAGA